MDHAEMLCEMPDGTPVKLKSWYPEFEFWYPRREWESRSWFVENIRSDWVCLDIGANVGMYSVLFGRLASQGQVHAFEPTSTYEMLCANLAYNGTSNCTPWKLALGAVSGRLEDGIFRMWGQPAERKEYDFMTLDDWLAKAKLPRLDLVKIDVDSFEPEVLAGANTLMEYDPFILMEIDPTTLATRGRTPADIFNWFIQRGYTHTRVMGDGNFLFRRRKLATGHRPTASIIPLSWPKEIFLADSMSAKE